MIWANWCKPFIVAYYWVNQFWIKVIKIIIGVKFFLIKWQACQGEDYCIECSIVNPITNILFRLYCSLQWSVQGSSVFCILCLGQLFVYYCTFRQYLFVRLHNLDSLYRYSNVCIIKECVLNKIIYHMPCLCSRFPPSFPINTLRVPKTRIFGGNFSKWRVKSINGSFWTTNLFKVL